MALRTFTATAVRVVALVAAVGAAAGCGGTKADANARVLGTWTATGGGGTTTYVLTFTDGTSATNGVVDVAVAGTADHVPAPMAADVHYTCTGTAQFDDPGFSMDWTLTSGADSTFEHFDGTLSADANTLQGTNSIKPGAMSPETLMFERKP